MLRYRIRRDELYGGSGGGSSEGAYGCVTRRPVASACSLSRDSSPNATGYVYKLFADEGAYLKELEAISKISDVLTPAETPAFLGNCAVTLPATLDMGAECPEMVRRGVFAPGATAYQIIYEYGGRSLLDVVEEGTVPFDTVWRSLDPVFRGLEAMERAGLAHADVKPDNVLFDETPGRSRLIDFGLTVAYDELFAGEAVDLARSSVSMSTPPEWAAMRMAGYSAEAVARLYVRNLEAYGRRVMLWLHPEGRRSGSRGSRGSSSGGHRRLLRETVARIADARHWTDSMRALAGQAPAFWSVRPEVYDVYGMGLLLAEIAVKWGPHDLRADKAFAAVVRRACACVPQERCTLQELREAYEATL